MNVQTRMELRTKTFSCVLSYLTGTLPFFVDVAPQPRRTRRSRIHSISFISHSSIQYFVWQQNWQARVSNDWRQQQEVHNYAAERNKIRQRLNRWSEYNYDTDNNIADISSAPPTPPVLHSGTTICPLHGNPEGTDMCFACDIGDGAH